MRNKINQFKVTKEARFTAYCSSTEMQNLVDLSVIFKDNKQNVLREAVKQLYENVLGVITRDNIKF
jgi:hypothetical protein